MIIKPVEWKPPVESYRIIGASDVPEAEQRGDYGRLVRVDVRGRAWKDAKHRSPVHQLIVHVYHEPEKLQVLKRAVELSSAWASLGRRDLHKVEVSALGRTLDESRDVEIDRKEGRIRLRPESDLPAGVLAKATMEFPAARGGWRAIPRPFWAIQEPEGTVYRPQVHVMGPNGRAGTTYARLLASAVAGAVAAAKDPKYPVANAHPKRSCLGCVHLGWTPLEMRERTGQYDAVAPSHYCHRHGTYPLMEAQVNEEPLAYAGRSKACDDSLWAGYILVDRPNTLQGEGSRFFPGAFRPDVPATTWVERRENGVFEGRVPGLAAELRV